MPKTNTEFWKNKIERNKTRDKEGLRQLAKMGWHTIVVWECQLKPSIRVQTLSALEYTLNSIYLKDHSIAYPELEEEERSEGLAAEGRMNPIE